MCYTTWLHLEKKVKYNTYMLRNIRPVSTFWWLAVWVTRFTGVKNIVDFMRIVNINKMYAYFRGHAASHGIRWLRQLTALGNNRTRVQRSRLSIRGSIPAVLLNGWYISDFPCTCNVHWLVRDETLTLSQWSSSGLPVAIQCAWNLDPSVHWNATGEMPVCFQWSSSGLPVAFQWSSSVFQLCKLTLDRHWNTTGC